MQQVSTVGLACSLKGRFIAKGCLNDCLEVLNFFLAEGHSQKNSPFSVLLECCAKCT
jgi:hypothetical protein